MYEIYKSAIYKKSTGEGEKKKHFEKEEDRNGGGIARDNWSLS